MLTVVRGIVLAGCLLSLLGSPNTASRGHAAGSTGDITETYSLTFVNSSLGWKVSGPWNPMTGTAGRISISRTSDGGLHWHPVSSLSYPAPDQILFVDQHNGWVSGSGLSVTHDGGATWRRISLHGSHTDLSVSGTSVWRLDSACSVSTNRCHFTLLWSTAGNNRWRFLSTPPVSPSVGWSIARATKQDAWITGGSSQSMNHARLALAATKNGGRTWRRLPMPCNHTGFGALNGQIVADTVNRLWLFCASQPGTGSQAKSVFRSFDAGQTWRMVARSEVFGNTSGQVGTLSGSGYLNDAVVTSSREAWMALGRSTLLHTTDGGRTWRPAIPISEANFGGGGVGPVLFIHRRYGWLLSFPTLLFRTSDGGRNWQRILLR